MQCSSQVLEGLGPLHILPTPPKVTAVCPKQAGTIPIPFAKTNALALVNLLSIYHFLLGSFPDSRHGQSIGRPSSMSGYGC